MTEEKEKFLGTYFDRDVVLQLAKWTRILAWVALVIYLFTTLASLIQFLLQFSADAYFGKGVSPVYSGITLFTPFLLQPLPGLFYFLALQSVVQALLILLDVEDNTRRAARK